MYPALLRYMSILFLNILTLLALTQSADNLFHSFTVLFETLPVSPSHGALPCPWHDSSNCGAQQGKVSCVYDAVMSDCLSDSAPLLFVEVISSQMSAQL